MKLHELLTKSESDWLDFKRQWYNDTVDLILDILCLANSDANSDRYLVIGYDENENTFGDISINRKNRDNFYNTLSTANFNRISNIHLKTIIVEDHEIDIIVIEKTNYRPYFLLKDKSKKGQIVRAGVIYTRNGSSNTPINESASENQIADMWRDRFGLTISPKERLNLYVKDFANWKYVCNPNDDFINIWHYEPFPEFTIEYNNPENMRDYSNPREHARYTFAHSIGNSYETNIRYKYHTTILEPNSLFLCDKYHFKILHPHIDWLYYNSEDFTDIHVFANNSQISDRGKTVSEIDAHSKDLASQ
ncbi:MAG: ATP-binding protein [Candidatus Gastranaerophilales bacterium]|nr:ATP-binding protein [Candidatus Gastranaerophilales bacterium]